MSRALLIFLLGLSGVGLASDRVRCKVTQFEPQSATFFSPGFTPTVGDTLDLDLTKNEITELKFAQGGEIALRLANAKLVDTHPNGADHYWEGTGRTAQSRYEGLVLLYCNETSCGGSLQILRKGPLVAWELDSMSLDCPRLP